MIECNNFIRMGKSEYKINTHFSVWIEFLNISAELSAEKITLYDFLMFLRDKVFIDKPKTLTALIDAVKSGKAVNQRLIDTALKSIMMPVFEFVQHKTGSNGKKDNPDKKSVDIFDFEKDWQYIDLAFLSYGIDLYNCNLHWWRFKWLLQAAMLDDFRDIVGFRSLSYSSISKMSKGEQKYYKAKKEAYALSRAVEKTAAEHWADMRKHIEKRYKEAGIKR